LIVRLPSPIAVHLWFSFELVITSLFQLFRFMFWVFRSSSLAQQLLLPQVKYIKQWLRGEALRLDD
jgi:hypothetical protein